jgi:acetyl-CoA carboxylase biotin carboxyl carrier protein
LVVKKTASGVSMNTMPMYPQMVSSPGTPMAQAPATPQPAAEPAAAVEDDSTLVIKAPMVGTFYRAPSPDSPSFIEVGQQVKDDTVVCILEAMKVMNEIKAGLSGTVTEILVENGQPVEFGQALMKVK